MLHCKHFVQDIWRYLPAMMIGNSVLHKNTLVVLDTTTLNDIVYEQLARSNDYLTFFVLTACNHSVLPKNNSKHDGRAWFGCGLWSHQSFWPLFFPTSKKNLC